MSQHEFSPEALRKQAEVARLQAAGEPVPVTLMFGLCEPATRAGVDERCRHCGADARPEVMFGGDGEFCGLCLDRGRDEDCHPNHHRPRGAGERRAGMSEATRRCVVEGCDRTSNPKAGGSRSMCTMHYTRWRRHGDPSLIRPRQMDPAARFWSKVHRTEDRGACWLFGGTVLSSGYGQFSTTDGTGNYVRWLAHRFAYTDQVGPIPEDMTIDHLCCVRNCVNPSHLEVVSASENVSRRHRREREGRSAS